jgi:uncharacterized membrane protein (Fun14 family)
MTIKPYTKALIIGVVLGCLGGIGMISLYIQHGNINSGYNTVYLLAPILITMYYYDRLDNKNRSYGKSCMLALMIYLLTIGSTFVYLSLFDANLGTDFTVTGALVLLLFGVILSLIASRFFRMKKQVAVTIILISTLSLTTFAQSGSYKLNPVQLATLKKQAETTANAIVTQNYKVLAKYTYPAIIQMAGGEAKMNATMKKGMEQMKAQGFSFKSIAIGDIKQAKKSGVELFAIVPDVLTMNGNGGTIIGHSALIAISDDNGKNWTFVDTAPLQKETITKIIPNYPKGLPIPVKSQPSFIAGH